MLYEHETIVDSDIESTFDWFERKGAFRRLMPPWEVAEEVRADPTLEDGAIRAFRFPLGPIKMTWVAKHTGYNPPAKFEDTMEKGPFKSWHHVHTFSSTENGCIVKDEVNYKLPMGFLGNLVAGRSVRKRIKDMFYAREIRLIRDMKRHSDFAHLPRKRILIAGSSGLIGRQLVAFLDTGGHDVWRLVRRTPKEGEKELQWKPSENQIDSKDIEDFDIIIHLGGAGIGDKRWSKKRMNLIRESRVNSTNLLASTISKLKSKPESLIVASAMGWYGDRGEEELTEDSQIGQGYLPEVCDAWEKAAQPAKDAGIRTIHARTGIVLDATGGALAKMLLPAKIGAGGPIGRGKQWYSWISMDDQIYSMHHLMMSEECEGVYNVASPEPVRQKRFAKMLGKVLRRPAFAPTPPFGIWLLFGKMGVALTTESTKIIPKRLVESGYKFEHEELESALRDSLGKWK
jgi:hypothetical protein